MRKNIYPRSTVRITDLSRHCGTLVKNTTATVAVLKHKRVIAYLVPAATFAAMMEKSEELDLIELVRQLCGGKTVKVSLDDFSASD